MSSDGEDDFGGWHSEENSDVAEDSEGEEDFEGEDKTFHAEIGAYDRVGFGSTFIGDVPKTRLEHATQDPTERFTLHVNAVARKLRTYDKINISEDDISIMIKRADDLEAIEHKNPTAYVLGFLSTGGGIKLTKKNFDDLISNANILKYLEESSVNPEDIIRYARLWQNLKK